MDEGEYMEMMNAEAEAEIEAEMYAREQQEIDELIQDLIAERDDILAKIQELQDKIDNYNNQLEDISKQARVHGHIM